MQPEQLAAVAAAMASESRARIVRALMSGTAHTSGELARHAGVAASTTSEHLGRLLDAGLVATVAQGRHRYYRLRDATVAGLVEQLGSLAADPPPLPRRVPSVLVQARACYDHLAGVAGVALHDRLVATGTIDVEAGVVTEPGARVLGRLGVPVGGRSCACRTDRRSASWRPPGSAGSRPADP